jgi:hypothetical protein
MTASRFSSPQSIARIAGALYLVVVALSIYALTVVSGITVRGDAAATAGNLIRDAVSFRAALVGNLVAGLCYVGVVGLLNELLKPVHPGISRLAVLFGLGGCVIGAMTVALQLGAPAMIGLAGAGADASQSVQMLMVIGGRANSVGLTFFGCYCLLIGWLVLGSGFIPRIFGALLILSGISWLAGNLAILLNPQLAGQLMWVVGLGAFGEILFTIWLVIKGVDGRLWEERMNDCLAR